MDIGFDAAITAGALSAITMAIGIPLLIKGRHPARTARRSVALGGGSAVALRF